MIFQLIKKRIQFQLQHVQHGTFYHKLQGINIIINEQILIKRACSLSKLMFEGIY